MIFRNFFSPPIAFHHSNSILSPSWKFVSLGIWLTLQPIGFDRLYSKRNRIFRLVFRSSLQKPGQHSKCILHGLVPNPLVRDTGDCFRGIARFLAPVPNPRTECMDIPNQASFFRNQSFGFHPWGNPGPARVIPRKNVLDWAPVRGIWGGLPGRGLVS